MSDIIPFPQNNEKLIKDIKTFFEQEKYEQCMMLSWIMKESLINLNTLLKYEMLLRMEQYLE